MPFAVGDTVRSTAWRTRGKRVGERRWSAFIGAGHFDGICVAFRCMPEAGIPGRHVMHAVIRHVNGDLTASPIHSVEFLDGPHPVENAMLTAALRKAWASAS